MIGGLGWQELLIVLVIVALVFGASRVADLGGALGKGNPRVPGGGERQRRR